MEGGFKMLYFYKKNYKFYRLYMKAGVMLLQICIKVMTMFTGYVHMFLIKKI
jgi:hypothetical protein